MVDYLPKWHRIDELMGDGAICRCSASYAIRLGLLIRLSGWMFPLMDITSSIVSAYFKKDRDAELYVAPVCWTTSRKKDSINDL